jgi:hypothetical protein
MAEYKPLRTVLFIYELLRLVTLLGVVGGLAPAGGSVFFPLPWLFYAVPNALFPLMTLFVRLDGFSYRPYVPLYTAGKVIAAAVLLGWAVFSFQEILPALAMNPGGAFFVLGSLVFMLAGDLFSIAGGAVLCRKEAPQAEAQTAERLSENGGNQCG